MFVLQNVINVRELVYMVRFPFHLFSSVCALTFDLLLGVTVLGNSLISWSTHEFLEKQSSGFIVSYLEAASCNFNMKSI